MNMFLRILPPVFILSTFLVVPALGQDIEKGRDAYYDGDYSTAMQELKAYSGEGEVEASYLIGEMYRLGNGVPKAPHEAAYWHRNAAEKGHIIAPYHLGFFYAKGEGVPKDGNKTIEWWCVSGRRGYEPAKELMVSIFNDDQKAITVCPETGEWQKEATDRDNFVKQANEGNPNAQFQLAEMYRTGKGGLTHNIAQDDAKAEEWYLKAAIQGHPASHYQLGLMHYHGDKMGGHLPVNYRKAFTWFSKGAAKGDVGSQRYLGFMLSEGLGNISDKVLSLMWYEIALTNMSEGENSTTKMAVRRLNADLSKAEITEARQKARQCMASRYQNCD